MLASLLAKRSHPDQAYHYPYACHRKRCKVVHKRAMAALPHEEGPPCKRPKVVVPPHPAAAPPPAPSSSDRVYTQREVEAIVKERLESQEKEFQERMMEQYNQFRQFSEHEVSRELHRSNFSYMS